MLITQALLKRQRGGEVTTADRQGMLGKHHCQKLTHLSQLWLHLEQIRPELDLAPLLESWQRGATLCVAQNQLAASVKAVSSAFKLNDYYVDTTCVGGHHVVSDLSGQESAEGT